jgi:hypothetical protein
MYRKRHTFRGDKPVWYGGGFWQRVEIPPDPELIARIKAEVREEIARKV